MDKRDLTVADLGELRLLKEIILRDVSSSALPGDDCSHISIGGSRLLWSMDPCPTPVANWFGKATPEVWGCYTAAINLSDIASSGGTPVGMLVSIEMPDTTPVSFVEGFQRGLMRSLNQAGAKLFGGNVKSAKRFSATGTIIGEPVARSLTRSIDGSDFAIYLVGKCGAFWASVVANHFSWNEIPKSTQVFLDQALCFPSPQVEAGIKLGSLPFQVACMDCSDGAANAVYQLASVNNLDVELEGSVNWGMSKQLVEILESNEVTIENACYSFGDWQLACLVPIKEIGIFEAQLSRFTITYLGRAFSGTGEVNVSDGRSIVHGRLNQNFQKGYNSIENVEDLIDSFMRKPIFV